MKRFFSEKSGCVSAAASFTEMIYFTFFSSISQRISYGSLASPTISKDSIRNRLKCGSFFPAVSDVLASDIQFFLRPRDRNE